MRSVLDVIKRICDDSKEGTAGRSEIITEAEAIGLPSENVSSTLDKMKRNGQIYEPSHGKYRLTSD